MQGRERQGSVVRGGQTGRSHFAVLTTTTAPAAATKHVSGLQVAQPSPAHAWRHRCGVSVLGLDDKPPPAAAPGAVLSRRAPIHSQVELPAVADMRQEQQVLGLMKWPSSRQPCSPRQGRALEMPELGHPSASCWSQGMEATRVPLQV